MNTVMRQAIANDLEFSKSKQKSIAIIEKASSQKCARQFRPSRVNTSGSEIEKLIRTSTSYQAFSVLHGSEFLSTDFQRASTFGLSLS